MSAKKKSDNARERLDSVPWYGLYTGGSSSHRGVTGAMNMETLSTGQLAREAGVGVETIRFYERKGLIEEPPRHPLSGYRAYPLEVVRRLRFIRRAKELGFTLREIRELLDLAASPETTCAEVRASAEAKLEHVRRKIEDLQRIERVLAELAVSCKGTGPVQDCPILAALDERADHESR